MIYRPSVPSLFQRPSSQLYDFSCIWLFTDSQKFKIVFLFLSIRDLECWYRVIWYLMYQEAYLLCFVVKVAFFMWLKVAVNKLWHFIYVAYWTYYWPPWDIWLVGLRQDKILKWIFLISSMISFFAVELIFKFSIVVLTFLTCLVVGLKADNGRCSVKKVFWWLI